ncbi:unnamed protein product [Cyprideis torosa]|uniref:Uncharacterized protein n=1 Tax=Cyprideis torosa TaxID=163714 RepID=A0A7R8WUD1_9CRUS|nr:unnamed protein product [Cyprideis torosa]CAG0906810.1 unnamed protein product [Cyprideis torosa]
MEKEAYIFEVSKESFGKYVHLNSYKLPVLVEFLSGWSDPAVLMSDLFSTLAKEFPQAFIFAKVDIDEQPDLVEEYNVKNIPTLLVFKDGKVVRIEEGQLQEVEARRLLKEFGVFRESDAMREQARDKHLSGDTSAAIILLTEAIQLDPGNTRIAMDMVQVFIDISELEQARDLFSRLPESVKETDMGKALTGQLVFAEMAAKLPPLARLQDTLANSPDDLDANFDMGIRLVSLYQYEDAMNHLFKVVNLDPTHRDGAAREMAIAVTNMVAPINNDMAQEFRRRLANSLSA